MNIFLKTYFSSLERVMRFLSVGFIATVIDFLLYIFFYHFLHVAPAIAGSISFSVSALVNFSLNNKYTFGFSSKSLLQKVSQFYTIAIGGLCLNYFLLTLLTQFDVNYLFAKMTVICIVVFYNYFFHSQITFKEAK